MSDNPEMEAAKGIFVEETAELLETLEESLLALEESPDDSELVGSIFRALHTIKGSGAMFGFDRVSGFTHEVETVFELVRSNELEINRELIDLTLASRDVIRSMMDDPDWQDNSIDEQAKGIVSRLSTISRSRADTPEPISLESTDSQEQHNNDLITWRIRFKPAEDIFTTGTNPTHLLDDLRELGDCKIVAFTEEIPRLSELNPENLHLAWDILLTTDKGKDSIEDVFIFIGDDSQLSIEEVAHHHEETTEEEISTQRLGDILVNRGELSREQLDAAIKDQRKLGEILVARGMLSENKIDLALQEQNHLKKTQTNLQKKRGPATEASIRVTSSKLDNLVNLVGELVTVQARLSQEANTRKDSQLLFLAEEVERLSNELRDNTMNIRMVPIGTTFGKFRRVVRDLSAELGREVALTTSGGDTELDKTVIEKLDDPMVHLIRNALDHGIEPPSVRQLAGKDSQGALHLEAEHSGAHVLIRIRDDGAGIDKETIRQKAVERNLLEEGAEISDQELYSFIFTPGFSTAQVISNVSGRGVGMDVVRNNIESLRGSIDIASKKGEGTTVTLKIPLTLAIIEGLLAKVGNESYILPLASVEECVELETDKSQEQGERKLVNLRGELVPYVYLRDHFTINTKRPEVEQIVITRLDGKRIGFVVDEVIGQHQTVIKNLGYLYRNIREISGATILGDGTLALIIDVPNLIQELRAGAGERE